MNYNSIGKIAAAHGVNGELVVKHALGKKTSLKGLQTLFIETRKGEFLPYFVQTSRMKNESEVFLQLEGVATREQAQKLVSKDVWLTEEDFGQYASKNASISLLGFHIITDGKDIGEILEVIEQPHQVLCRIDLNGKEALIPVHQGSLISMDQKNKLVNLDLPAGLLELYG